MASKKFIRTIEDFACEHCGSEVSGNGYTNHCPVCLWSKHVDIFPGDRQSSCLGLMKPIAGLSQGGEQVIVHSCTLCKHQKKNKIATEDNFEVFVTVSKEPFVS